MKNWMMLVPALLLAGCAGVPSLQAEVKTALIDARDDSIVLDSLDSVNGTDFLVVCPYESESSIADRLGFTWDDAPDYSQVDDRQTIAIVNEGRVVNQAELSRADADFCSDGEWGLLPTSTELRVTRSGESARRVIQP